MVESEAGVSLVLGVDDYEGFTNLDVENGSDTQSVEWYTEGGEEPRGDHLDHGDRHRDRTQSHRGPGHPRWPDSGRIQPLTVSYELALPGGAGTVTGSLPGGIGSNPHSRGTSDLRRTTL